VTVLPLLVLEACAVFGVNQGTPVTAAANPGLHTFALEPFRFLGVLHIVLMHDTMDVRDKFGWQIAATFGKYWVQFFFALSGLVLFISQGGAPHVSNPGSFIMKRVWGIYPVYAFSILMAMFATEAPRNYLSELPQATLNYLFEDIMPGFLLVDSWAWPYGIQIPNGPAWFVCTLFAFWLCFPHWYSFLRGVRSPKLVMLFAYLSTFGLPVLYAAANVDGHCFPSLCAKWDSFVEFHPFANWQVFVFGMCMGRVLQDTDSNAVPLALRMIGGTVSLLTLFSLPLFSPTPSDSVLTLFLDKGPFLLPIFAMLLYLVPLGDDILLRPAFMESKLLAYSGAMSGHFFLLHIPVKLLLDRIAGSQAVPITAMLPSQLLFSIVVYEAHTRLLGPSRTGMKAEAVQ
jgi:peptidoglycan/LPS O-acetylase OafA/YrhL